MDFNDLLKDYNLNENQLNQLAQYADSLISWNEKFNLTAITEPKDIYIKHFADCLLLNQYDLKGSLADVGSGAGFPGLVLKIANPDLEVTLVEPNGKRCLFLNEMVKMLQLDKISVVNQRAEDYASEHREQFDFVTARAVSALNILSELCIPLLKPQGHFLAMKGPKAYEEVEESAHAFKCLNCHLLKCDEFSLDDSTRIIVDIVKDGKNDQKYPRNYSQIKKKPL